MDNILPLRSPATESSARTRRRRQLPFVLDARRLAWLLDAGLRTIRAWDAAGKVPAPLRISGRVVWRTSEIRAWLRAGAPDRATWTAMRAARKK